MDITRRDFLKASAALAAAMGVGGAGLLKLREALARAGGTPVIWLQANACTGDSVSLLNSIYYTTIDDLLVNTLDVKYHPNLSAAAGPLAVAAAETARAASGYVLCIEGAIPTGQKGRYCELWPGMTALQAVKTYAANASVILAVGNCASFGGFAAGKPNPTRGQSVSRIVGASKLINLPGCPAHPDWVVGTVAYLLQNGRAPALDKQRRPTAYFTDKVLHETCPRREYFSEGEFATRLTQKECLYRLGCRGLVTHCDCPTRKWNSGARATAGVNWCNDAGAPCIGCTQPKFQDSGMAFFTLDPGQFVNGVTGATSGGGDDDGGDDD